MGIRNLFRRHPRRPPVPQQPTLPPGDKPIPVAPGQRVKPDEVRELRELIRRRYELDLSIWRNRHVGPHDRSEVMKEMRKSDATLRKITATIETWDRRDVFESDNDWLRFLEIKRRIEADGKRTWAEHPPWEGID